MVPRETKEAEILYIKFFQLNTHTNLIVFKSYKNFFTLSLVIGAKESVFWSVFKGKLYNVIILLIK